MTHVEATAQSHPALTSAMIFHLDHAWQRMQQIIHPQDDFLKRVETEILKVPVRNVYDFMRDCLSDQQQIHTVGFLEGVRPEGFLFNVTNSQNPLLAKIYFGSGIDQEVARALATKSFPYLLYSTRSELQSKQRTPQEEVADGLSRKTKTDPYLYASAEVLTRMMAHLVLPAVMDQPTALIDKEGEAVGFYLELEKDQEVERAQTVAQVDVALFPDPTRQSDDVGIVSFHYSKELPPDVVEAIDALRKINVLVYQGVPEDLLEQVLYDKQGKFVTFARVGYDLSKFNQ